MAYKVRLEDLIDVGAQVAEEDDYPHPKQIRVKGLLLLRWVLRDGTHRGEEGTEVGGGSCLASFIFTQGQTEQEMG